MGRIKGATVILYNQIQTGTDPLGAPIYEKFPEAVHNVLVGEPSSSDITTSTQMYGKVIKYMLGIPKGDKHDWMDKSVDWIDPSGRVHKLKTFGFPVMGIEANIPGPWHMKVGCEEYGG